MPFKGACAIPGRLDWRALRDFKYCNVDREAPSFDCLVSSGWKIMAREFDIAYGISNELGT